MVDDILSGTWKGELIFPGNQTYDGKDEITEFLIKITCNTSDLTLKGIFISDPETTGITDHAKLAGEIGNGDQLTFEIRYSKLYFSERLKKQVFFTDSAQTKLSFEGNLINKTRLLGDWRNESTYLEHQGTIKKTIARNGKWWARKLS